MNAGGSGVPLLRLTGISRIYRSGDTELRALDDVSLDVHAGEFVAIVGQSGSGKSTLMNIIGCLDRPDEGRYFINGCNVGELTDDELAALRRDTFGFVFQRYNLLPSISAAENVELPSVYAGRSREQRAARARQLLKQLGLGDRTAHRPNELSGGQQQRVSIARALANEPAVILADEPTGALDSHTGHDVLELLKELHARGQTILLITHDAEVAAHAPRTVQLKDGRIVDDSGIAPHGAPAARPPREAATYRTWLADVAEAVKMALRSLRVNLFRTLLTLLGVVIGVGAVVTMLAIGNGSKQEVLERIQSMGTNLLMVFPGAPGTRPTGEVATLVPKDADALRDVPGIIAVSPERGTRATVRAGRVDYQTNITGVWPGYATVNDWRMAAGSFINQEDVDRYASVTVLGNTVAETLFPGGAEEALGSYVLLRNIPFEVIGVLAPKGASAWGSDMDDIALVPLSTGFVRLFGTQYLNSLRVQVEDGARMDIMEAAIRDILRARHGSEDFRIRNTTSLLETVTETQNSLTVLLGSVAAISLLVGGIGVMNIMLVSVTERTREIGVRKAIGARTRDILLQFSTEALVVCGLGGLAGVALGIGAAAVAASLGTRVVFSTAPAVIAFASAFAIGLLFGYLPARKAANLDPVVALASE